MVKSLGPLLASAADVPGRRDPRRRPDRAAASTRRRSSRASGASRAAAAARPPRAASRHRAEGARRRGLVDDPRAPAQHPRGGRLPRRRRPRDGRDALDAARRDADIDLVVTDVEMPEMDGIELTRAIRAHATRSALPVVIVTSLGERGRPPARHRGRRRRLHGQAQFDQHDLLETVERLVGR